MLNYWLRHKLNFTTKCLYFKAILVLIVSMFLVLFVFSESKIFALTRAGTVIENNARVTYLDNNGNLYQGISNTVLVKVASVPGVNISPGITLTFNSMNPFIIEHNIYNTGNVSDIYNLELNLNDNWNYNIFYDKNNNQSYDDSDKLLEDNDGDNIIDTGLIEPSEKVKISIRLIPPQDLVLELTEDINITAFSSLNPEIKDEADNKIRFSQYAPFVSINESPDSVYSGQKYNYKIAYENQGDTTLNNVLVRNILEPEIVYLSATDNGQYIDDIDGKRIEWDLGQLLPGKSGYFEVDVYAADKNSAYYQILNIVNLISDESELILDKVETNVYSAIPKYININVSPEIIKGDGKSTALFTVNVNDGLGQAVPDGALVTFETETGVFKENGKKYLSTLTQNGIATARLISPKLSGHQEINNRVTVTASSSGTGEVSEDVIITFIPGGIAGEIVDENYQIPLSGIKVKLMNKNGDQLIDIPNNPVYTNEQGRYFLIAPHISEYQVIIELPDELGQIKKQVNVSELEGAVFYPPEAVLGQVRFGNANRTQNLSRQNILSVANAEINIYDIDDDDLNNPLKTSLTDKNGNFILKDLDINNFPAEFIITAQKTINNRLHLNRDTIKFSANGQLKTNKILTLYSSGIVIDKDTDMPIGNVSVNLVYAGGKNAGELVELDKQDNPVKTGLNGQYIIFAGPGSYKLKVETGAYQEYISESFISNGDPIAREIKLTPKIEQGLVLKKQVNKEIARPGEEIVYKLKYKNISDKEIKNIKLYDSIPDGIIINQSSISNGGLYDPVEREIVWNIGTLDINENDEYTFSATVSNIIDDGSLLINRAWIEANYLEEKYFSMATAESKILRKPDLLMNHNADINNANVGDIINYNIYIENKNTSSFNYPINNLNITGFLPEGFTYIKGSSTVNNNKLLDPDIEGNKLSWIYDSLATGEEIIIRYKTKVGAKARASYAKSQAFLNAETIQSESFILGPAINIIEVSGSLFTEKSALFGRVFLDYDDNGIQDLNEPGLENIELIMDEGTIITTDNNGDYSYNLWPGEYTIGISPESFTDILIRLGKMNLILIDSYNPEVLAVLKPGTVKQFNFPLPVTEIKEENVNNLDIDIKTPTMKYINLEQKNNIDFEINIKNNSEKIQENLELYLFTVSTFQDDEIELKSQFKEELNIKGNCDLNISGKLILDISDNPRGTVLVGAAVYNNEQNNVKLKYLLKDTAEIIHIRRDDQVEKDGDIRKIVSPEQGSLLERRHINVKVRGQLNDKIKVYVNSKLLDFNKVGKTLKDKQKNIKELDYISVGFKEGKNTIKTVFEDSAGDLFTDTKTVYISGELDNIYIAYPKIILNNNKNIELPVYILSTDNNHIPAGMCKPKIKVEKGNLYNNYVEKNVCVETIYSGLYRTQLISNGYYDKLNLSVKNEIYEELFKIDLDNYEEKHQFSGASTIKYSGKLNTDSRNNFQMRTFMRKKIDEDNLFTFKYDSAKKIGDSLFNISDETDNIYNDYGDNSTVTNDTASATGVFAVLENEYLYALYGDISTSFDDAEIINLDRKLTGFKIQAEKEGKKYIQYFVDDNQEQIMQEIIPEGTSGYYFLDHSSIIPGSEIVNIITKVDNSSIHKEKRMYRNQDYLINYKKGTIMFENPVNKYNNDFNENIIEVKYKIPTLTGENFYIGSRLVIEDEKIGKVGFSVLDSSGNSNQKSVYGFNGDIKLNQELNLKFEIAKDNNDKQALKTELIVDSLPDTSINLLHAKQEQGFSKPGDNYAQKDFSEYKGNVKYNLNVNKDLEFQYHDYINLSEGYHKNIYSGILSFKNEKQKQGQIKVSQYDQNSNYESKDAFVISGDRKFSLRKNISLSVMKKYLLSGDSELVDSPWSSLDLSYKYSDMLALKASWLSINQNKESIMNFNVNYEPINNLDLFTNYKLPINSKNKNTGESLSYGFNNNIRLNSTLNLNLTGQRYITNRVNQSNSDSEISLSTSINYINEKIEAKFKHEIKNSSSNKNSQMTGLNLKGDINNSSSLSFKYGNYSGSLFRENGFDLLSEIELNWTYRPEKQNLLNGFTEYKLKEYGQNEEFNYSSKILNTFTTNWVYNWQKNIALGWGLGYKSIKEKANNLTDAKIFENEILSPQLNLSFKLKGNNYLDLYNRSLIENDHVSNTGCSIQFRHKFSGGINLITGYNTQDLAIDSLDNKNWNKGYYYQFIYSIVL